MSLSLDAVLSQEEGWADSDSSTELSRASPVPQPVAKISATVSLPKVSTRRPTSYLEAVSGAPSDVVSTPIPTRESVDYSKDGRTHIRYEGLTDGNAQLVLYYYDHCGNPYFTVSITSASSGDFSLELGNFTSRAVGIWITPLVFRTMDDFKSWLESTIKYSPRDTDAAEGFPTTPLDLFIQGQLGLLLDPENPDARNSAYNIIGRVFRRLALLRDVNEKVGGKVTNYDSTHVKRLNKIWRSTPLVELNKGKGHQTRSLLTL